MARYRHGQRVGRTCTRYGSARSGRSGFFGNLCVGRSRAGRDIAQGSPHSLLECGAAYVQRQIKPEARRFEILDPGLTEVSPAARDLAHLLVRKRRVAIAADLTVAYRDALNRERGIVRAAVTTAVELSDPGRQALAAALQQSSGARAIEVDASVDREILGGAIIRVGDHILDGSVRTRLRGLRRSIAGSIA